MGSLPPSTKSSIPIVDFSAYNTSPSAKQKIAHDLVSACRDVGFVYITGHGVPESDLAKAFEVSKKFYDLPLEEKMKAPHPPGYERHRGYSWPGWEKISGVDGNGEKGGEDDQMAAAQDFKESYEIGSEANADQANIWPPDNIYPEWQPFMTSFYWTCFAAAADILRALAIGIGLSDEDHLLKLHSGNYCQLRLLHYPPIPAKDIESGKYTRMPAHCDYSTITLLFQDERGGLQVESPHRPGEFIDVPYMPGSLVMNVGDQLMYWSNDYLRSTKHRVGLPLLQNPDSFETADEQSKEKGERMMKSRYSIPYFLTTDPDLVIECLRTEEGEKPKYKPITQREFAKMKAGLLYKHAYQQQQEEKNAAA